MKDSHKARKVVMIPVIPASGGEPETLFTLPFERIGSVSVTPEGKRIVCAVTEIQSDVWVMEHFDPAVEQGLRQRLGK